MSISLQKGQKVSLSKDNAGLSKIIVGLGWDEVQQSSSGGGFLSALFGGGSKQQPIERMENWWINQTSFILVICTINQVP